MASPINGEEGLMLERIASLSFVSFVALIAACNGKVPLGTAPSASSNGQDGSTATGPWSFTCTTYWRASGTTADLAPQTFTARSDATTKQTITYADGTVDFDLAPAPDDADQALLTVKTSTRSSMQTYRISRTRRPVAQFAGDHGFTGLVYVGGVDLQYICVAEGATPPARAASAVPLDVTCQIELRTTPGGAVEKRDTMTYAPDLANPGPDKRDAITYQDDLGFTMYGTDGPYEGRGLKVGITRPQVPSDEGVAQLFQLDRNARLVNHLVGTSFTGRVAVTAANGKELSYACNAVSEGDDPTCSTHDVNVAREAPPSGACTVSGATCAFEAGGPELCKVPGTQSYPTSPAQYNCTCTGGSWQCNVVEQGKGISPCPATVPACTTGAPLDPYQALALRDWESTLPATPCPMRCGDTSQASWGAGGQPFPTFSALPTGSCETLVNGSANSCGTRAVQLWCPKQTGPNLQGSLFDVECRCEGGSWKCYGAYNSGGALPPCQ